MPRLSLPKVPDPQSVPTSWSEYKEKWKDGCGSPECERASRVVLARGSIPCDVLFIGEAPGVSEDVLGKPFKGPAGKLLDQIILLAFEEFKDSKREPTYAMTNIVGCIPLNEEGRKVGEPDVDCIERCAPRLQDFLALVSPKLIVMVGKMSSDWLDPKFKNPVKLPEGVPTLKMTHPSAILRMNVAQRGLAVQRCVVDLNNAVIEMIGG